MFAVQPPLGLTPVPNPSFSPGGWSLEYGDSRETELRTRVKDKEEHVLAAAPTPVLYFQKCPRHWAVFLGFMKLSVGFSANTFYKLDGVFGWC